MFDNKITNTIYCLEVHRQMKITKKQLERLVENQVKQIQEGRKKVAKILGAIQMLSPEDKQLFFSQIAMLAPNGGATGAKSIGSEQGSVPPGNKKEELKRMLKTMVSEDFAIGGFRNTLLQLETSQNKSIIVSLYHDAERLDDLLEDYSIESDEADELVNDMLSKIAQL